MLGGVRPLLVAITLGVAVVGCIGAASPAPSAGPSAVASPSSAVSAPTSPSAAGGSVPWDAGLLDVLPAEVDGLPLTPESDAFAESASDPALVRDIEAGAVAFVVDPASEGYAVTFVYRLRDGVFDDTWFRDWRDSFDDGVCAQAGGVKGRAEADLDGRVTYIGSCAGGVLTYHAHLADVDGDLVVSTQSLGESRLGEQVMSDLGS